MRGRVGKPNSHVPCGGVIGPSRILKERECLCPSGNGLGNPLPVTFVTSPFYLYISVLVWRWPETLCVLYMLKNSWGPRNPFLTLKEIQ